MISEKLLEVRTDNDLTQLEMAKILKTSQSNYSRWENNREIIPLKKLNSLCNYFNISMDYLIGNTNNKNGNGTHIINNFDIGNNIKEVRKKNNITQKELAKVLNTTQSTISAYESGETLLLTAFAIEISKRYKVSMDKLCGRIKEDLVTTK